MKWRSRNQRWKWRNLPLQPTKKTLSNLRFALRGGNFDQTEFLSSMEAIDGIVIDLGLDLEKFENKWQEKFSTADEI